MYANKPVQEIWYLLQMRAAKVETSLPKCAVSTELSLLADTKYRHESM